jgi:AcrB/AcrD/AcrF family
MSFNISAWSIRKPIATLVLFLVLMIAGIASYPTLGIDENPNIDVPTVSVTVTQPGADPAELETQITKKVEDSIAGLGNIDQIISTVNQRCAECNRSNSPRLAPRRQRSNCRTGRFFRRADCDLQRFIDPTLSDRTQQSG